MKSKVPFEIETKIEWAELDLFGHVNNVAFFSYIQKARICFCEHLGLTALNETNKLGFIVASSHCDFKIPLFYPGTIKVVLQVVSINNSSFEISYQVLNQLNQIAAEAKDVLVLFNYKTRTKQKIEGDLKHLMQTFLR